MTRRRTQWLAWLFVGLAVAATVVIAAMATGHLQVDGEWPGLLIGLVLLMALLFATRRP
jgi:uncharacterized membrane protein YhaH (DUF805 family)